MKVIIVGNAGSLLDKENGHLIDEFDVVIRFNDFRIRGYEKYCGTKTDVVVSGLNRKLAHMIEKGSDPHHEWWRDNDCAYDNYMETIDTIWYTTSKEHVEQNCPINGATGVTCEEIAAMSNIVNFNFMDCLHANSPRSPFFYLDENREYSASPSAGLITIGYVITASTGKTPIGRPSADHHEWLARLNPQGNINMPPQSLAGCGIFITGFDGFSTGHYYCDNNFPSLPKDATVEEIEEQMKGIQSVFGHDAALESKIVDNLVRNGVVTEL